MSGYTEFIAGVGIAPTREAIKSAVLDFDDANNGWNARVEFRRGGEYMIVVDADGPLCVTFDTLWEFEDWALRQEIEADEFAMVFGESRNKINEHNWARVLEGATK